MTDILFLFQATHLFTWLPELAIFDIHLTDIVFSGNTPLHLAARAGKTTAVATLLHQGATAAMKVTIVFILMMMIILMRMDMTMMMMAQVIEIVKS